MEDFGALLGVTLSLLTGDPSFDALGSIAIGLLQSRSRFTDSVKMGRIIAVILSSLVLSGCLLPDGTPVYIDGRHGKLWSGNGILLRVSEDRAYCRVAARNRALVVEKKWVDCKAVHPRMPGDL